MECPDFKSLFNKEFVDKEFCWHVLAIVVGRSQMATMGQRYGNSRKTFEQAVTVSNEQFALMVIDDRWELWEAITVKRKNKVNVPINPNDEANNETAEVNDDNVRDENDFRKIDPTTKYAKKPHRLRGTNLTRYSMYGKYCADYRGHGNGNAALGAMVNSIGGNVYPFRMSDDGKQLREIVQYWWGEEVNSGPKRKRKLVENQKISVQYTKLTFFTRLE